MAGWLLTEDNSQLLTMPCEAKTELLSRYLEAASSYLEALKPLESPVGDARFETLMKRLDQARAACVQARDTMNQHQENHGCGDIECLEIGTRPVRGEVCVE